MKFGIGILLLLFNTAHALVPWGLSAGAKDTSWLQKHASYFGFQLDENGECAEDGKNTLRTYMTCKMLIRNLQRDSQLCNVDPDKVFSTKPTKLSVSGRMSYMGLVPLQYRYKLVPQPDGTYAITVKIHFKNASLDEIKKKILPKVKEAEAYWNAYNVSPGIFKFVFKIMVNESAADFSINLKDSTRGPYCTRWGKNWGARTIAHEFGHMMGLDDEYPQLISTFFEKYLEKHLSEYGDSESLMYAEEEAVVPKPMPYHYYLIFRRALCN